MARRKYRTRPRVKGCALCKPHKNGWEDRRTVQVQRQDEADRVRGEEQDAWQGRYEDLQEGGA